VPRAATNVLVQVGFLNLGQPRRCADRM